jgi:hypothetical protein
MTVGAELADQGTDRVIVHAKLVGDALQGAAFHEVGADNLVVALPGVTGIGEEVTAERVIHDGLRYGG